MGVGEVSEGALVRESVEAHGSERTSSRSSVMAFDSMPLRTSPGPIPCTTRSIRESSENCLPDMRMPRTRRLIAGAESPIPCHNVAADRHRPWSTLTEMRMPAYTFARNSSASKMAANEPFTIFGDIGELASRRLDPNASSLSSSVVTVRISFQSDRMSSFVVYVEVTVKRIT
uniref:Uncharacterized protein n=1 Tax=Anopheles coluzzii TaxID=1518534 RepID=A0A8W7Q1B2_ANOCL